MATASPTKAPQGEKSELESNHQESQALELPYSLEMVATDKLFVDTKYQRSVVKPHVKRMDKDFDGRMFTPLMVNKRRGGKMAVFDGQHRLETAYVRRYKEVPCLVYNGLSPQEEATLFSRLQRERRNITPTDRFRADLFGDPERPETKMAREIEKLVEDLGFTVGNIKKEGKRSISSPSALEQVYRSRKGPGKIEGPDALRASLAIIGLIWAGEHRATDADLIKGMGLLFLRHADKIDEAQLLERLREVTPGIILGRAQEERTGRGGGGAAYAVYRALVHQYNRGRGGKRIQQPKASSTNGSEP